MVKKRFDLSGIVVLLVDDNDFVRDLIHNLCRSYGITDVLPAASAEKALEILHANKVDLIICDWAMTPVDGIDFTKRVRTDQGSPDPFVPIIMLTAHAEYERVTRARDAGVHEFLAKPISSEALLSRILHIVEHPRDFVRVGNYFGPDRRRTKRMHDGPERRVKGSGTIAVDVRRLTSSDVAEALGKDPTLVTETAE